MAEILTNMAWPLFVVTAGNWGEKWDHVYI